MIASVGPWRPAKGSQGGPGHRLRPVIPPRAPHSYLTGRSGLRLRLHTTNKTHKRKKRREEGGRNNLAPAEAARARSRSISEVLTKCFEVYISSPSYAPCLFT
ncbi:unnamed protein product [Urochloa humidicola]